jgi:polysaccharide biosynthesis/export protein VpsN
MLKLLPTVVIFIATMVIDKDAIADTLSEYRLGSGDTIRISVFEEPDLSLEIRLSDAGTVSYPFLGELQVKGLTVGLLETAISTGLKGDYLVEPNVTVSVSEYRQIYINGEVTKPGGFSYLPGLTLRKAITLAGGFTERASKTKMYVIREGLVLNSTKGSPIGLDEEILPGDIVTIEQSFF